MKKLAICAVLCAFSLAGCKNNQSDVNADEEIAKLKSMQNSLSCERWPDEECPARCSHNGCVVSVELVKAKLAAKADPNLDDKNSLSPLMRATDVEGVKLLIAAGARLEDRHFGETALTWAIRAKRDIEIVKALIDAGADINALGSTDDPAIMTASEMGIDYVKALIEAKADVNAKNRHGKTAVMVAQNMDILKALIAAGADVNAGSKEGYTALMLAEKVEILKALIDAGADVNAKNKKGNTALMITKKVDVLKALIAAGADVNAQNSQGDTAVMLASNGDIVRALIDAGADLSIKNKKDKDVVTRLTERKDVDEETIEFVRSRMNP